MEQMYPLLQNYTLLDITVPGTHDSLTYDLSTIISLGADDSSPELSEILHLASEIGITPSSWIRNQSKTQGLSVSQQLDSGVRFVDFRIMYTSDDWYSLHFMQSNHKAVDYLREVRSWIDSHPKEIVTLWLSKHGSPCATGEDQYPGVTVDQKRAFWSQLEQIMSGVLVNAQRFPINETTIGTLVANNNRVVVYASDYILFTGSSPYATDACLIDNTLCSGVSDEVSGNKCEMQNFENAESILKKDKAANKFFLMSMASSGTQNQLLYSFLVTYIDIDRQDNILKCAQTFNIPGMDSWCPPHLQDISQLTNYYNQISLEASFTNQWGLPNAIYIDAVDSDGAIRTGTQLFKGNELSRYAYVATLLHRNLRLACTKPDPLCDQLLTAVLKSRASFPYVRWNDTEHGRIGNWPI
uniref:Phosphatidylinositol-specific phospholipase C X domain-containing protein n=1 Tax=Arcella intermedia TaxID=1963864 RepID=A0A6B2L5C7_9EUKA